MESKMKPCSHPEGPEAYHKVVLNVTHATKARLERALCFYSQGDLDRDTAINLMLDAAANWAKHDRARRDADQVFDAIAGVFPGARVTK